MPASMQGVAPSSARTRILAVLVQVALAALVASPGAARADDPESLSNPPADAAAGGKTQPEPGADAPAERAAERGGPEDVERSVEDELQALEELDDEALDIDLGLYGEPEFPDPFEPMNRAVFRFNQGLDELVLDPLTRFYGWLAPGFMKTGVRNFFRNLDAPVVAVNDALQLEWEDAGTTMARFGLNTTVGLAGFLDVAEKAGLPWHHSDFGQTLALAGMPSGPYLVLPILGPTTVRDGLGFGVDTALYPLTWLVGPVELIGIGGADGISVREAHLESLEALEEGSVDFYAAFRNAYSQNRRAEIWSRRQDRKPVGVSSVR